ncbi:alpha/beta fold hydrolase [Nonomuraea aurantiaca]|uniref:alpha/beta fold hydrolase n=1 Tax=Nonomuraea aurantiaca TaxID=2878562 RepID=UPI001CD97180|nr:alpha/beta fold hydrolase [Nonomuraea aurantiaca]MCA2224657.1 alpha/beta fold hydrolase [Nonomuraea aurantiaca]
MTTFVLVSGAWHGPWAWDGVVPLVERAGARTVVPDLAYGRDVGLHDHVAQVVAALDADEAVAGTQAEAGAETEAGSGGGAETGAGADAEGRRVVDVGSGGGVVLVGHSYGGLVIRQVADLRPERVDHVITVEGWVGGDGDSMFSLAPEGFVEFVRASADGWQVPAPAPALFGITDPADAAWLQERLRPQPLRTFTEGARLTGAVDQVPGTGVYCRPQTFAFDRFAEAVGYRTVALDGPHDVLLTDPGAVAAVLLRAGAGDFVV